MDAAGEMALRDCPPEETDTMTWVRVNVNILYLSVQCRIHVTEITTNFTPGTVEQTESCVFFFLLHSMVYIYWTPQC